MTATVIPFAGALVRQGWSPRELSEIYRLADVLAQRGLIVEIETGVSDEGDPWLVLSYPGEPDVAAHVARIDGRYLVSRGGSVEEASTDDLRELLERALPPPAAAAPVPAHIQPDFGEALLTATLLIAMGVVARDLGPGVLSSFGGLAPTPAADATPVAALADRWIQLGREAMALLAPVAPTAADPVAPDALAGLPPVPDAGATAPDHLPASALRQWLDHLSPADGATDDAGAAKPHVVDAPAPAHPEGSAAPPDTHAPEPGAPEPGHAQPTAPAAAPDSDSIHPQPETHSVNPGPTPLPQAPQPASAPAPAPAHAGTGTVIGPTVLFDSAGNHTVLGTDHGDVLVAGAGNDLIIAGNGNNLIIGGSGHDTIVAGAGNDTVIGGSGPATISGGAGNDLVVGGGHGSVIYGGSGNDVLISGDAVQTGHSVTTTVNQQTLVVGRDAGGQVTVQNVATNTSILPTAPPPPPAETPSHTDTTTTDSGHGGGEVTLVGVSNLPHNQLHL